MTPKPKAKKVPVRRGYAMGKAKGRGPQMSAKAPAKAPGQLPVGGTPPRGFPTGFGPTGRGTTRPMPGSRPGSGSPNPGPGPRPVPVPAGSKPRPLGIHPGMSSRVTGGLSAGKEAGAVSRPPVKRTSGTKGFGSR
jgi:hypothetical protein